MSVSSVIRGYFNGMYDMKATSNSQILEQFLKSVLIIVFLQIVSCVSLENIPWTKFGIDVGSQTILMAIVANAASTLATVLSCVYLIIFYQKRKKQIWMDIKLSKSNTKVRKRDIIRRILAISIPISFASIISALNKNIDTFTVVNCLKISLSNSFSSIEAIIEEATRLYGILSGKVDILIGMPVALNVAFATALVPAISSEVASGDLQKARQRINFSIRMTVLIALSCTVGMSALAGPILKLLFPNAYSPEAILLLQISSISIVFLLMNQTIGGILQGLGKAFVPATSLGVGVIMKLVLNLVLIPSNNIGIFGGINGSAISTIIAQCVAMFINLKLLSNNIKLNINLTQSVIKPIIVSVLMGGVARFVYTVSIGSTGYFVSVLLAIIIAIIAFLVFVIFFKIFDEADYHMLPFGKKLYDFLYNDRKNVC